MVYCRTQRIQEEKKQRLRYGIRKFTGLGAASALLGSRFTNKFIGSCTD